MSPCAPAPREQGGKFRKPPVNALPEQGTSTREYEQAAKDPIRIR